MICPRMMIPTPGVDHLSSFKTIRWFMILRINRPKPKNGNTHVHQSSKENGRIFRLSQILVQPMLHLFLFLIFTVAVGAQQARNGLEEQWKIYKTPWFFLSNCYRENVNSLCPILRICGCLSHMDLFENRGCRDITIGTFNR